MGSFIAGELRTQLTASNVCSLVMSTSVNTAYRLILGAMSTVQPRCIPADRPSCDHSSCKDYRLLGAK